MLSNITFTMRVLITAALALVFLWCASFPDEIIPPDPAAIYAEGITIHFFHDKLWFYALVVLELFVLLGPQKNRVWFMGAFPVFLIALLAWPVLAAHCPEWVHPTHNYQGGMLTEGLYVMAIYLGIGTLVRLVLAHYFFPVYKNDEDSASGEVDASVLDAMQQRTVQEIAANPARPNPHFLFGEADMERVTGFRAVIRRYFARKRMRVLILLFLLTLGCCWVFLYPQPTEEAALERDLQTMYATRTLPGGQTVGTKAAVHAAYRVMDYISRHEAFAGLTREQAEAWLRLDRVSPTYRRQLRDERDIDLPSVDSLFESRERFLTVTDGKRVAVLYIRTNAEGDRINIAEAQDAGWDAVADENRRLYGRDFDRDRLR